MFLLYCETIVTGNIALPALHQHGLRAEPRSYSIDNHYVAVDGNGNTGIATHDAEHLCTSHLYRLATTEEQEAYTVAKSSKNAIRESVSTTPTPATPTTKRATASGNGG